MGPIIHPRPEAVMVIRQIHPLITTFSLPFARHGVIKFGGRATAVQLANGKLAVFSPVSLTEEVKKTISDLGGNVGYLIAPDIEHHIHLTAWHEAFPTSEIIAPEGLKEKREGQGHPNIPFQYIITKQSKHSVLPPDFAAEFKVEYFPTHPNKELAFLHIPTKSLILADLLFNLPAKEQYSKAGEDPASGLWTKLFVKLIGGTEGAAKGQQRFNWYLASGGAKGRKEFGEGIKEVGSWEAERVVICHGDNIEGKEEVGKVWEKVFKWFLDDSVKK